jgi:hypothetical protein
MGDIKLFRTAVGAVTELHGQSVVIEKTLQTLLEKHLDAFLGVTFLASEYVTGKRCGRDAAPGLGALDLLTGSASRCQETGDVDEAQRLSERHGQVRGLLLRWRPVPRRDGCRGDAPRQNAG